MVIIKELTLAVKSIVGIFVNMNQYAVSYFIDHGMTFNCYLFTNKEPKKSINENFVSIMRNFTSNGSIFDRI